MGYPDIAIFPEIARALDIGIEELFGEAPKKRSMEFPASSHGMPLVHRWRDRACYSLKQVAQAEDDTVTFADGSTANLSNRTVRNFGKGEIYIAEADQVIADWEDPKTGPTVISRELEPFESVSVEVNGSWDAEILPSRTGAFRIEAKGPAEFIESLEIIELGGKLCVKNKNTAHNVGGEKHVAVHVGFEKGKELSVSINGSGWCKTDVDFEKASLSVAGSGEISCRNVGEVTASVAGSGDISLGECKKTRLSIAGSGYICAKSTADPEASVAGSGDIDLGKVSGNARVEIAGSGDVALSGEVENFYCEIVGSGGIDGEKLAVSTAEVYADGSAEINLGRIKISSVERLSKESVLKVGMRG